MADAPRLAATKPVSSRLSRGDQAELQWFFGRGQTAFERSTMGGILDRSQVYDLNAIREMYSKNGERSPYPHGPITARPTAELQSPPSHEPDDKALTRYARVSRRLIAMEKEWRLGVVVLETFFGDVGARWADSDQKRLFALYPLTLSGKRLLKADAKRHPDRLAMPDHERIGVLALLERKPGQSKQARRVLLMQCEKQATALLSEAGRVWNSVKHA